MAKQIVILFLLITILQALPNLAAPTADLFREYIGAEFNNVKFTDVPVNPQVDFHFLLAFAIDYDTSDSPSPTNGQFNVFWDTDNLGASQISSVKSQNPKIKVALSLGGDSVSNGNCYFTPSSVDSWYNLDGIDIDYEHFKSDPQTFAECIGRLITTLKKNGVISFASIAPFDDPEVQSHYQALWNKYGNAIDYYYDEQSSNYDGGKVLVSFISDGSGGLSPADGFFKACDRLKKQGKLQGIFAWSADDSKANGFRYERQSQAVLATPN
ncbi:unnamed protein product [Linum tenue]|uniref:GH18 domain-containing protein n=1 Tax=Linum tenue TaxID=586396 RepID=A0AAV0QHA7_9ROSI|nr:unnamed protein product [Linum tenue]CAI0544945.1 unnamed protein product [Linum tenue]